MRLSSQLDMPLSPEFLSEHVAAIVGEMRRMLNKNIDIDVNLKATVISVTTPGTPDTTFTVTHALGVIPVYYLYNVDKAAIIYDMNRATAWTKTTIDLRCNVATVAAKMLVFG